MMTMEITQIKRPVCPNCHPPPCFARHDSIVESSKQLTSEFARQAASTLPGHYENNKGAFHEFILWPVGGSQLKGKAVH